MADERTEQTAQSVSDMLGDFEEEILDGAEGDQEGEEEELEGEEGNEEEIEGDEGDEGDDDDSPSELEETKALLAAAQATIATIATKGATAEEAGDDEEFEAAEVEWEDAEFIPSDFDMDQMTPEALNGLLNKVAKSAANIGAKSATQQVLLSVPKIVKHNVTMQSTLQDSVRTFYKDNEDLIPFKGAVAAVSQELASQNPDWSLEQLFKAAGVETKKRLGLKTTKKKTKRNPTTKTTLRSQRKKGTKKTLAGLEGEIDAMLGGR